MGYQKGDFLQKHHCPRGWGKGSSDVQKASGYGRASRAVPGTDEGKSPCLTAFAFHGKAGPRLGQWAAAQACHPSTGDAEAGGSEIQSQPNLRKKRPAWATQHYASKNQIKQSQCRVVTSLQELLQGCWLEGPSGRRHLRET